MNRHEILDVCWGNCNARDAFGRRQCGEEREGQVTDGGSKFGPIRPVPGIDGVKGFERQYASALDHPDQIQTGVGDGAGAAGETDQRQNGARRPDFGVVRLSSFQGGQGKNNVADGAWPDQKSSHRIRASSPAGRTAPAAKQAFRGQRGSTSGTESISRVEGRPAGLPSGHEQNEDDDTGGDRQKHDQHHN
jgi:hypothetical protein